MPESGGNLNFIACLALHQNRRDSAIGLTHVTKAQNGLLWYYNVKKQDLFVKASTASFKHGAMQQIDKRMSEIMIEAESATLERKRELLTEALKLKKQAQRVIKV